MSVELILLILSLLFFASIFTDKVGYRFGVPTLLLFLLVGMLFGTDGLGIEFSNLYIAQAIGTCALCVILFSGGMDTKIAEIRPVIKPGITLATLGVILTAGITGVIIWLILGRTHQAEHIGLVSCLLMAATMASTDSASVFSILRNKGVSLKHNLRPLLELESGSNDPMAYVLTTTLIGVLTAGTTPNILSLVLLVLMQIIIGAAAGLLFGKAIVWLMNKVTINNESLYPILVFTACIFIFSSTYYLQGNSYLAVYIGGLVIGNSKFAHKRSTMSFFDGLTWLCQLGMFLMLGLLVNPRELLDVAVPGLIVSVVMIFVSRPLSVFISMLPFRRYDLKDKAFVSWVGLRGAVPIIFAILCKASRVEDADIIFNIVFFCTLVSLIVQGTSLTGAAKLLGVAEQRKRLKKPVNFDIDLPEEIKSVATEIKVTDDLLQHGNRLMDLGLPQNTLVIMVKRGKSFFVPSGKSVLQDDDALLVITDNEHTLRETYQQIERQRKWTPALIDDTYEFLKQYILMMRENHRIWKERKQQRKKNNSTI